MYVYYAEPNFNPNGFRHVVSDKLLALNTHKGVTIIKRWLHNQTPTDLCSTARKQGPHFHYLVNISQELFDKQKLDKKHRSIIHMAKILHFTAGKHSCRNETANNYESLSEDETENLTKLALPLPSQHFPRFVSAAISHKNRR